MSNASLDVSEPELTPNVSKRTSRLFFQLSSFPLRSDCILSRTHTRLSSTDRHHLDGPIDTTSIGSVCIDRIFQGSEELTSSPAEGLGLDANINGIRESKMQLL